MSTLKLNQCDFKKRKYKYALYCSNCGKSNHLYSQCHNPITSYGICCFLNPSDFIDINKYKTEKKTYTDIVTKNISNLNITRTLGNKKTNDIDNDIKWKKLKDCVEDTIKFKNDSYRNNEYRMLMINRNYTIGFMEFIRGKYDVENEKYIFSLFEKMTLKEIDIIALNSDFVLIRKKMNFYDNINKKFKHELENAKLKYNYITKLGILKNILTKLNVKYNTKFELGNSIAPPPGLYDINKFYENLNLECETNKFKLYKDTEWLYPKGKREDKETDLKTALREFYEETGINSKYLNIFKNIIPIELNFIGLNGIEYRNVYFIAELSKEPRSVKFNYNLDNCEIDIYINKKNKEMVKEVSNIKFLSMYQCINKCRDYEIELQEFISCIFNFYINFKKFFYA